MTKFNTIISKLPALPAVVGRYDVDFIETADKFLNDLPPFAQVYNTTITEINNAGLTIQKIGKETESLRNETLNYKNSAYAYKEDAISAANSIKSYVIPQEVTYSKNDLDSNHNSLLTVLTTTQAQVSMLNKFQSDLFKNVAYKKDFDNYLSEKGYQKLPGGLILQWGSGTFNNESSDAGSIVTVTIDLPIKVNKILNTQISTIFPDEGIESNEHTCAISMVSNAKLEARFERIRGSNNSGEKGYFNWFVIAI